MDPQERLFIEAVERGDKHTMIRCLQGAKTVNVNTRNIMGRSAIQIAVDNENVEIVELLLKQKGIKVGDALLYAIREGVYRITEMLIDHPTITQVREQVSLYRVGALTGVLPERRCMTRCSPVC